MTVGTNPPTAMNAAAYLSGQGWKGHGHALKPGGISKPILTSKKTDLNGLGSKGKESDQWWDNIFSKQLQSFDVIKVLNGPITITQNQELSQFHPIQARHKVHTLTGQSRLSRHFVKGEGLHGSYYHSKGTAVLNSQATERQRGETLQDDSSLQKRIRKEERAKRRASRAEKLQCKIKKAARKTARRSGTEKLKLKTCENQSVES